jgi:hypothetical protein
MLTILLDQFDLDGEGCLKEAYAWLKDCFLKLFEFSVC